MERATGDEEIHTGAVRCGRSGKRHRLVALAGVEQPSDGDGVPEGAASKSSKGQGAVQGKGDGRVDYLGPCPLPGTGVHHYVFILYAMKEARLHAEPGTSPTMMVADAMGEALDKATRSPKACPRTMPKPQNGISSRPTKVSLLLNTVSAYCIPMARACRRMMSAHIFGSNLQPHRATKVPVSIATCSRG